MDPSTLRAEILRHVANHEEAGGNGLLSDEALTSATGESSLSVQRQLEILGAEGLLDLGKTFGPTYAVRLTPKGILAIEGLDDGGTDAPRRPIGY
jgi:hypothetical protein